jgi:hypothetical protein
MMPASLFYLFFWTEDGRPKRPNLGVTSIFIMLTPTSGKKA